MPNYLYLKTMLLLWQLGLVDTLTMIQIFTNTALQYGTMVGIAASSNHSACTPKLLLDPILGLLTSYQYIKAAPTSAEVAKRAATVAVLLSSSVATAFTSDGATNLAQGSVAGAQLSFMREVILKLRGGSDQLLLKDFAIMADAIKTPVVPLSLSLAQIKFHDNCKLIIQNMWKEQLSRRYVQRAGEKFKMIEFSPSYMAPIVLTQLNTIPLIVWTCFGFVLIGFTILGALYLFQCAERKRHKNNEIVIDVTDSSNS
jgi:hypothetical protein